MLTGREGRSDAPKDESSLRRSDSGLIERQIGFVEGWRFEGATAGDAQELAVVSWNR